MSNLTIRFYSNCLRRYTTFKMYLPCDIRQDWGQTDTKYSENSTKTLFLLHGFTGDAENWVPEYLADKYNFAVVIPSDLFRKILFGWTDARLVISSANSSARSLWTM